jgi:hypothetical protein
MGVRPTGGDAPDNKGRNLIDVRRWLWKLEIVY